MNYKQLIIEMLQSIDNDNFLRFIYKRKVGSAPDRAVIIQGGERGRAANRPQTVGRCKNGLL